MLYTSTFHVHILFLWQLLKRLRVDKTNIRYEACGGLDSLTLITNHPSYRDT
jgi:hypothetical protein